MLTRMARSEAALERNRAACRERARRLKAADPEGVAAKKAEYYQANREKIIARSRASARRNHLKRAYGITLEEYDALVSAVNGECPACGRADRQLVVDHDHDTGEVRGLLCNPCNSSLGLAQDSVEVLMGLAAYLMQSKNVLIPQEEVSCRT